jgi:hypothetical protein
MRVYLQLLKQNTHLGASENDVAGYLLTKRLEEMLESKYLENHLIPTQTYLDKVKDEKS